jgi:hypothetical protein
MTESLECHEARRKRKKSLVSVCLEIVMHIETREAGNCQLKYG